jgi:hypothetical protein
MATAPRVRVAREHGTDGLGECLPNDGHREDVDVEADMGVVDH